MLSRVVRSSASACFRMNLCKEPAQLQGQPSCALVMFGSSASQNSAGNMARKISKAERYRAQHF